MMVLRTTSVDGNKKIICERKIYSYKSLPTQLRIKLHQFHALTYNPQNCDFRHPPLSVDNFHVQNVQKSQQIKGTRPHPYQLSQTVFFFGKSDNGFGNFPRNRYRSHKNDDSPACEIRQLIRNAKLSSASLFPTIIKAFMISNLP